MTDYTRRLVLRCKHLVDYSRWLCLETMPLKPNDTTSKSANRILNLTEQKQQDARVEREQILENNSIIDSHGINMCRKLIKDLERCKLTKEKYQIAYFQVH